MYIYTYKKKYYKCKSKSFTFFEANNGYIIPTT